MTEPINLNEARADKANDARLWSPIDCLRALLRDLETGECNPVEGIYIAMVRKNEGGSATTFPFYTAGLTALEIRGLLAEHLHAVCDAYEP